MNAPVLAHRRGIEVRLLTEPESPAFRNVVTPGRGARGRRPSCRCRARSSPPAAVRRAGRDRRATTWRSRSPSTCWCLRYTDRPGVIGTNRQRSPGVNIAAMQVGRTTEGGSALSVLTLDDAVPVHVGAGRGPPGAHARAVRLVDLRD